MAFFLVMNFCTFILFPSAAKLTAMITTFICLWMGTEESIRENAVPAA